MGLYKFLMFSQPTLQEKNVDGKVCRLSHDCHMEISNSKQYNTPTNRDPCREHHALPWEYGPFFYLFFEILSNIKLWCRRHCTTYCIFLAATLVSHTPLRILVHSQSNASHDHTLYYFVKQSECQNLVILI